MRSTAVEFFASGDTNTSITAHISAHPALPLIPAIHPFPTQLTAGLSSSLSTPFSPVFQGEEPKGT